MAISKDKRRQTSNEKYVDALQDRYSKLCVVRVDFGYKKDENNEVNITLEEANKHIDKLLNNRRNNSIFKDNVGYVIKTEYTEDKGVHNHAVLFFDGKGLIKWKSLSLIYRKRQKRLERKPLRF